MKGCWPLLVAVALFLFSSACAGTPTASPGPTPSPEKVIPVPEGAQQAVELALQDLAARLGVAAGAIQVAAVQEVEWRDSSLGCPEPGKAYAQVITPGYQITLAYGGQRYDYRSDRGRYVVLCQGRDH